MRSPLQIVSTALGLALVVAMASSSGADPSQAEGGVYDVVDRNGDGRVDHAEYQARQVDVFLFEDDDKDGALSPGEAGLDASAIAGADRDGDGKLQLQEFLDARARDFEAADANKDGTLSPDEIRQAP